MREYSNKFEQVRKAKTVPSQCNAILFLNKGTNTAFVNNMPIETDNSLSMAGLYGEKDISRYDIRFATGGTSELYVIRKFYV
ncbi:MAG: hypothetical protein ACUZ8H_16430 [Candidatus Anammoxibacter sp.]